MVVVVEEPKNGVIGCIYMVKKSEKPNRKVVNPSPKQQSDP